MSVGQAQQPHHHAHPLDSPRRQCRLGPRPGARADPIHLSQQPRRAFGHGRDGRATEWRRAVRHGRDGRATGRPNVVRHGRDARDARATRATGRADVVRHGRDAGGTPVLLPAAMAMMWVGPRPRARPRAASSSAAALSAASRAASAGSTCGVKPSGSVARGRYTAAGAKMFRSRSSEAVSMLMGDGIGRIAAAAVECLPNPYEDPTDHDELSGHPRETP